MWLNARSFFIKIQAPPPPHSSRFLSCRTTIEPGILISQSEVEDSNQFFVMTIMEALVFCMERY